MPFDVFDSNPSPNKQYEVAGRIEYVDNQLSTLYAPIVNDVEERIRNQEAALRELYRPITSNAKKQVNRNKLAVANLLTSLPVDTTIVVCRRPPPTFAQFDVEYTGPDSMGYYHWTVPIQYASEAKTVCAQLEQDEQPDNPVDPPLDQFGCPPTNPTGWCAACRMVVMHPELYPPDTVCQCTFCAEGSPYHSIGECAASCRSTQPPPECPEGMYWDHATQRCVEVPDRRPPPPPPPPPPPKCPPPVVNCPPPKVEVKCPTLPEIPPCPEPSKVDVHVHVDGSKPPPPPKCPPCPEDDTDDDDNTDDKPPPKKPTDCVHVVLSKIVEGEKGEQGVCEPIPDCLPIGNLEVPTFLLQKCYKPLREAYAQWTKLPGSWGDSVPSLETLVLFRRSTSPGLSEVLNLLQSISRDV